MSKIVVHRVLLYSIVQHKVWFLFRIIKRKTLTSCTRRLHHVNGADRPLWPFGSAGRARSPPWAPAAAPSSAWHQPLPRRVPRHLEQCEESGLWRLRSSAGAEPPLKPFGKPWGFGLLDQPFPCCPPVSARAELAPGAREGAPGWTRSPGAGGLWRSLRDPPAGPP